MLRGPGRGVVRTLRFRKELEEGRGRKGMRARRERRMRMRMSVGGRCATVQVWRCCVTVGGKRASQDIMQVAEAPLIEWLWFYVRRTSKSPA